MSITNAQIEESKKVIAYYTLAAATTGAIPVPAASTAIVAQNGCMLSQVSSILGQQITWSVVVMNIKFVGVANMYGRALFIEAAKALSWGSGSPWAALGLSTFGAATAGLQTYILGSLAIEICKKNGTLLSKSEIRDIIMKAKQNYSEFIQYWKNQNLKKPEYC